MLRYHCSPGKWGWRKGPERKAKTLPRLWSRLAEQARGAKKKRRGPSSRLGVIPRRHPPTPKQKRPLSPRFMMPRIRLGTRHRHSGRGQSRPGFEEGGVSRGVLSLGRWPVMWLPCRLLSVPPRGPLTAGQSSVGRVGLGELASCHRRGTMPPVSAMPVQRRLPKSQGPPTTVG